MGKQDMLVQRNGISDVLPAIPTERRARRIEIFCQLKSSGLRACILPGLIDIADGTLQTSDLHVTIIDLLQRPPAPMTIPRFTNRLPATSSW